MTKAELGTKRICPNCGTKYYDLNRSPIVCPKCGTVFMVTAAAKARAQAAKAAVEEEEEVEVIPDKEAELVSLEEADEEAAESGAVKGVNRFLTLGREADVHAVADARDIPIGGQLDPEFRVCIAVSDAVRHDFHDALIAERSKDGVIKLRRLGYVPNAD